MRELEFIEQKYKKKNVTAFKSGDRVKVHVKIKEGEKERIQIFEGVVIKYRHAGVCSSFTVRKVSYGVGVERVFPLHSPIVHKIELVQSGKVRRAKLYYLRELSGRRARIEALDKEMRVANEEVVLPEEEESEEDQQKGKAEKTSQSTKSVQAASPA